jgi:hypothetical protein
MNTSIVIPLGTGSRWGNTELRYALRSVEKHLTGYGDIFIIGECPSFLQNVTHIPANDIEQTWAKEANIFRKIMVACEDPRVSDDFLFMNDDHFLLQDYQANQFPFYYDGLLSDKMTVTEYKHTVKNTHDWFLGAPVDYLDIHCPILYNKRKFEWCLPLADWSKPYGYCIKTAYCYINGFVSSPRCSDLKINQPLTYTEIMQLIAGRPWFSIGDAAREGEMLQVLQELYPNKSKFEK